MQPGTLFLLYGRKGRPNGIFVQKRTKTNRDILKYFKFSAEVFTNILGSWMCVLGACA